MGKVAVTEMVYLFVLVSLSLAFVTRPLFMNLLMEGDLLRPNYRGESIPLGMGLYLFFNLAVLWSFGYVMGLYPIQRCFLLLMLTGVFSFLGFIDDLLGDEKARGLVGHFRCLLTGRLTTGGLKALGAAVMALVVVYYTCDTVTQAFVSWVTLLFTTNFINLLDLRPGRAVKVFLLGMFALFVATGWYANIWYLAIPLVPVVVYYFPLDLSAIAMMGDTGANLLGGILGYFIIQTVGFWGEVIIAFFLMLLHLYSERSSLSMMIEENRLLHWFDQLGRRRVE